MAPCKTGKGWIRLPIAEPAIDTETAIDSLLKRAATFELRALSRKLNESDPLDPDKGSNWIGWRIHTILTGVECA